VEVSPAFRALVAELDLQVGALADSFRQYRSDPGDTTGDQLDQDTDTYLATVDNLAEVIGALADGARDVDGLGRLQHLVALTAVLGFESLQCALLADEPFPDFATSETSRVSLPDDLRTEVDAMTEFEAARAVRPWRASC